MEWPMNLFWQFSDGCFFVELEMSLKRKNALSFIFRCLIHLDLENESEANFFAEMIVLFDISY